MREIESQRISRRWEARVRGAAAKFLLQATERTSSRGGTIADNRGESEKFFAAIFCLRGRPNIQAVS